MDSAFSIAQDEKVFRLEGVIDLYRAQDAKEAIKEALDGKPEPMMLDVSRLTKLDTVGAMMLRDLQDKGHVTLAGFHDEHRAIFAMVSEADLTLPPEPRRHSPFARVLITLGKATVDIKQLAVEMLTFFGRTCVTLAGTLRHPSRFRFGSVMHHIEETGIHAVPIVGLIAFLISIVLAYQAIAQLRPLGGEQYTVNLVAISVLREMGVLLTAIMVAGRSGSAFAAEIGVMKVREEVDALQVIGIDPFEMLVIPRVMALIIVLPLLTFIANLLGILGGGVISQILIDMPLSQYFDSIPRVVRKYDFFVGMVKAPVFAFLIAMVGCMHGMKVSGSAESVGQETTASVVKSIFLVLIADAIFSIVFGKLGI